MVEFWVWIACALLLLVAVTVLREITRSKSDEEKENPKNDKSPSSAWMKYERDAEDSEDYRKGAVGPEAPEGKPPDLTKEAESPDVLKEPDRDAAVSEEPEEISFDSKEDAGPLDELEEPDREAAGHDDYEDAYLYLEEYEILFYDLEEPETDAGDSEEYRKTPDEPGESWITDDQEIVLDVSEVARIGPCYYLAEVDKHCSGSAPINTGCFLSKARSLKKSENVRLRKRFSGPWLPIRYCYKKWIENGKSDPKVAEPYVFLFLHGLEREALAAVKKPEAARLRIPAILDEVRRLRDIYGGEYFFHKKKVDHFLDVFEKALPRERLYESVSPRPGDEGVSWDLKVGLGQLIAEGKPIPADWMLAWVMLFPNSKRDVTGRRCAEELQMLFAKRYEREHGEGSNHARKKHAPPGI